MYLILTLVYLVDLTIVFEKIFSGIISEIQINTLNEIWYESPPNDFEIDFILALNSLKSCKLNSTTNMLIENIKELLYIYKSIILNNEKLFSEKVVMFIKTWIVSLIHYFPTNSYVYTNVTLFINAIYQTIKGKYNINQTITSIKGDLYVFVNLLNSLLYFQKDNLSFSEVEFKNSTCLVIKATENKIKDTFNKISEVYYAKAQRKDYLTLDDFLTDNNAKFSLVSVNENYSDHVELLLTKDSTEILESLHSKYIGVDLFDITDVTKENINHISSHVCQLIKKKLNEFYQILTRQEDIDTISLNNHIDVKFLEKIIKDSFILFMSRPNFSNIDFNEYLECANYFLKHFDNIIIPIPLSSCMAGYTSIYNRIFISSNFIINHVEENNEELTKAALLIVIIHEFMHYYQRFHLKMKDLKEYSTPREDIKIDDKTISKNEGGRILEMKLFGEELYTINLAQARFLLNEESWDLGLEEFRKKFKEINKDNGERSIQLYESRMRCAYEILRG